MEVWSKLPDDVIESIFRRLTLFDILRLGSTCTTLRALVSSHPSISSFFSSVSLLLFLHPLHAPFSACAYDGSRDAWLKLRLTFLRHNLPAYPVASAGGLLCFGCGRDFVICNPISRSWRKLPSLPPTFHVRMDMHQSIFGPRDISVQAFGLMTSSITGIYDFFIIYHSQYERVSSLLHYSSLLLRWRVLKPLLASQSHYLRSSTIICCNSRLYTLWAEEMETSWFVFAYSDSDYIWTKIESPDCTSVSGSPSSILLRAFLMGIHGNLHMVGAVGTAYEWEFPMSVHIWKLHVDSNEWMEVTHMPSSILEEFHTHIGFDGL